VYERFGSRTLASRVRAQRRRHRRCERAVRLPPARGRPRTCLRPRSPLMRSFWIASTHGTSSSGRTTTGTFRPPGTPPPCSARSNVGDAVPPRRRPNASDSRGRVPNARESVQARQRGTGVHDGLRPRPTSTASTPTSRGSIRPELTSLTLSDDPELDEYDAPCFRWPATTATSNLSVEEALKGELEELQRERRRGNNRFDLRGARPQNLTQRLPYSPGR